MSAAEEVIAGLNESERGNRRGRRRPRPVEVAPAGAFDEGVWAPPDVVEACRHALRRMNASHTPTIGVTSCLREEGRSTIAASMAVAEHSDRSTILVELDLERPALARRIGLDESRPGVADILRNQARIEDCLQPTRSDDLRVITAGSVGDDSDELLLHFGTSGLVEGLRRFADTVVADLPPLSPVGRATSMADRFTAILLVIRSGAAPTDRVRDAVEELPEPPAVILNAYKSPLPRGLRKLLG
jgi:Mrp family chromosome partitioning ATPase